MEWDDILRIINTSLDKTKCDKHTAHKVSVKVGAQLCSAVHY